MSATWNSTAKPSENLRRTIYLSKLSQSGQAVVEFTLAFILLLVVAFIPADFGLAFLTGQLAMNASREGARIAAADRNPAAANCTMPCGSATNSILIATAKRMSPALLPGAQVSLTLSGTCPLQMVTVSVAGQYNYFYYKVLRLFGRNTPNNINIVRSTTMRWEHQTCS
jgi:Flp pilus assembly protein TadG